MLGLLITGTGSKLRWPSSFRAAAENFGEMRSRRRRLIVLRDTARMGAVGTAHKDPLPRRAPVRLDKQIDKQSFNRLRV